MENEFAKGHRQRLKEKYTVGGFTHDYELLELLLTYSIPRRDVKPCAKELLRRFGSAGNVLNASTEELKEVRGIGESSALLISLVSEINNRAFRNADSFNSEPNLHENLAEYCTDKIKNCPNGTVIMITLDNANNPISCTDVSAAFDDYFKSGNMRQFGSIALRDCASGIAVAEKSDKDINNPSLSTISFLIKLNSFFREIGTELTDYYIIGNSGQAYSMRASERYNKYF